MITKEQALTLKHGTIIRQIQVFTSNGSSVKIDKPANWRINGKCKTWKTIPQQFQVPIKHGLYEYGYLTDENAHLFELVE